jgi:16S rRNA (guanine527-N7)-methyltransferase
MPRRDRPRAHPKRAPAQSAMPPRRAPDPARTLDRQPWVVLRPLLPDAEQDHVLARLKAFAVELLTWNRGVSNLVAHDDEARLVERHLAESLAGAALIRELGPEHLVDVGSGGGFPAIPLAIAGVGRRWTLVESRRNKTLFLRRIVERMELRNIAVLTGRLEVLVDEEHDALQCDGFTSRATMKAGPTLELAARIVRPGGHAILWKGSGLAQELAAAGAALERDWEQGHTQTVGDGPNSIALFTKRAER